MPYIDLVAAQAMRTALQRGQAPEAARSDSGTWQLGKDIGVLRDLTGFIGDSMVFFSGFNGIEWLFIGISWGSMNLWDLYIYIIGFNVF